MKNNKKIKGIFSLALLFLAPMTLSGCKNTSPSEDVIPQNSPTLKDESKTDTTITDNQNIADKKLVIDEKRCVGCGKCAKLAPSNFQLNNKKATIVSQDNLDDTLKKALVEVCPGNAISIM